MSSGTTTRPDPKKSGRAMAAVLQMTKIGIAAVERAYAG